MRVAIYNRWLHIGGGGERHGCAIATALAGAHEVTLLTHRPVDIGWLSARLGLDLSGVAVRLVPDSARGRLVAAVSTEYDLFVNTSYGDLIAPCARRNLLLAFFPPSLGLPTQPAPLALARGFYAPEQSGDETFCWSDGEGCIQLAPLPEGTRLRLWLRATPPAGWPDLEVLARAGVGKQLMRRLLPPHQPVAWQINLPHELCRSGGELRLASSFFVPAQLGLGDDWRALGVQLLGASVVLPGHSGAAARVAAAELPFANTAWEALAAYQLILANSAYTQGWVARRWGRRAHILYPPVAIEEYVAGPKQAQILSVGRFFTGLHNKGQLELVRSFTRLCDEGLTGWRLVLAGAVDEGQATHLAYVDAVRAAANGYPVIVETNIGTEQLRALYAESALYWHASGFGADAEAEPERCEHFGISIVEAMAAGCVPLAYGCGGPAEIIAHGQSGLLWYHEPELRRLTLALAHDPAKRTALAAAAQTRSRTFGWEAFVQAILTLNPEC